MTESPLVGASDLTDFQSGSPALHLAGALAAVRSFCGWHIAPERTETVTLHGSGSPVLLLPTLYLVDVLTVTDSDRQVALTDLSWDTSGIVDKVGYWSTKRNGITVQFVHGYSELPADVRQVVLGLADAGVTNVGGGRLKQAGPFTYDFSADPWDKSVLDHYRLAARP